MKMNNLDDLYLEQINDLYSAEKQLVQALPKLAKAATSAELKTGFEKHLEQTKNHVHRIEEVFTRLGSKPGRKTCAAMEGLVKEATETIDLQGNEMVRDAALIGAAQRIEHYEIAGYGIARTLADQLGYDEQRDLLQQTLNEEGETDKKLTALAQGGLLKRGINEKANKSAMTATTVR